MKISRRAFLKTSCAAAAGTLLGGGPNVFAAAAETAELVCTGGPILTMNPKAPHASAMAIRGGKVLAVGDPAAVAALIAKDTQVVDLKGRGVSPGLIDAHSHLIGFGQMQLMYVLLRPPKVTDFPSLRKVLAEAARQKPPGEWIIGRGFKDFKEGRYPRREELDAAVPRHPLLLINWSGQFGIANTLALKTADLLRADVEDPYGGKYLRDKRSGLPDGVLIHYPAIYSVYKPLLTDDEQRRCAAWAVRQFAEQGVTCVHDNFIHPEYAATYVRMERSGDLPLRIRVYPYVWNLKHAQRLLEQMRRYRGPLVRMQGVKLAVDGYPLLYNDFGHHEQMTVPMHPQGQLEAIIAAIHNAGLQADVHAAGDKGVDWTLAAFSKAAGGDRAARERRHRIEHFPFRKMDSIKRAADMGVPVCTQPAILDVQAEDFLAKMGGDREGRRLVETLSPLRSFLSQGAALAFGADVPAFPSHRPLDSLRCAMDRRTETGRRLDDSEAISFLEALKVHTLGGAWASFDEGDLGSLEPGKLADFVIWNMDLRKINTAADLAKLEAMATYVGGKKVFDRAAPKA